MTETNEEIVGEVKDKHINCLAQISSMAITITTHLAQISSMAITIATLTADKERLETRVRNDVQELTKQNKILTDALKKIRNGKKRGYLGNARKRSIAQKALHDASEPKEKGD